MKPKKEPLVCLDRDGTINKDDNYYLGSSPDWRKQVEFLPGVVQGIKALNEIDILPFILTNQSGVALGLFDETRMHEVNKFIISQLESLGARIKGYIACPFVDSRYAERKRVEGREINPKYVDDKCEDIKPRIGMISRAANRRSLDQFDIYMIGDRASDVEMGLNAGGTGILIEGPKTRELRDFVKVGELMRINPPGRVYIATNFTDAAHYVIQSISSLRNSHKHSPKSQR